MSMEYEISTAACRSYAMKFFEDRGIRTVPSLDSDEAVVGALQAIAIQFRFTVTIRRSGVPGEISVEAFNIDQMQWCDRIINGPPPPYKMKAEWGPL